MIQNEHVAIPKTGASMESPVCGAFQNHRNNESTATTCDSKQCRLGM